MKKLLIVPILFALTACVPSKTPDAVGGSVTGAKWADISSHYTFPKELEGCKTYRLSSADDSSHPSLYVVDCGRPVHLQHKNGKLDQYVSVL